MAHIRLQNILPLNMRAIKGKAAFAYNQLGLIIALVVRCLVEKVLIRHGRGSKNICVAFFFIQIQKLCVSFSSSFFSFCFRF